MQKCFDCLKILLAHMYFFYSPIFGIFWFKFSTMMIDDDDDDDVCNVVVKYGTVIA